METLVKRWLYWSDFAWLISFLNAGILNKCPNCEQSPVQKLILASKLLCHLWFENIPTLMWRLKSLCSLDQSTPCNVQMGHYRLQVFSPSLLMMKQLLLYSCRVTWWLWTPVRLSSISGKSHQMSHWLVLLHLPYLQCIHTFAFEASWPIIQAMMELRSTNAIAS